MAKWAIYTLIAFEIILFSISGCEDRLDEEIVGRDGAPMVLIPAGTFQMGNNNSGSDDEKPEHKVYLDAFYIDKYPVTNGRYREFMAATGHESPLLWNVNIGASPVISATMNVEARGKFKDPDWPVLGISWNEAKAYCDWAGKRLPTEAEWEKATRLMMTDNVFPEKDAILCIYEWCADWYYEGYYAISPEKNPKGPTSGEYRVLRGGLLPKVYPLVRSIHRADREYGPPDGAGGPIIFRCVQDVGP